MALYCEGHADPPAVGPPRLDRGDDGGGWLRLTMPTPFVPKHDVPIPYMQRTRNYYLALGYGAYRWAHFVDVPFTALRAHRKH